MNRRVIVLAGTLLVAEYVRTRAGEPRVGLQRFVAD